MIDDRFDDFDKNIDDSNNNDLLSPSSEENEDRVVGFHPSDDEENSVKSDEDNTVLSEDFNSNLKTDDSVEESIDNEENQDSADDKSSPVRKVEESSISADLIRGHINTIILRALYERDKYGYEIIADIEKKSHGQYTLKQPTLYSALKRLENQGYIKAYWKTDEVSSGGRRKYFTLTESGREVTETNLSEWEYSRTIIDSLISDRSFDFSRPAPTPVDFTILRDSVSRVPVVRSDESDRELSDEREDNSSHVENTRIEVVEQITEQAQEEAVIAYEDKLSQKIIEEPAVQEPVAVIDEDAAEAAERRRIVHENYMRLISAPVREPEPIKPDDIVPGSRNVNADNLLYNNKPEPERDYKNLVDGIFNKAVRNGSVQTTYVRSQPIQPPPRQNTRPPAPSLKIADKGRADGITVTSSSDDMNLTYATKTTYNKGLTLFKCSSIVFAITVIEFIFCLLFRSNLKVSWIYPTVILAIGFVQFAIFGILLTRGYGQNCVRPTTNGYISTCLILTVLAILIICAASFLLNMNATLASDILKMIVIPSITALNLTIFAVFFKLFIK